MNVFTDRIRLIRNHLRGASERLSLFHGPNDPPLVDLCLDSLIDQQAAKYGEKTALICSATQGRYSFKDLQQRSRLLGTALRSLGVGKGDRIAIMAGNRAEYVDYLFAAARCGAILAVINNTYTPAELHDALKYIGCEIFITSPMLGRKDNRACLSILEDAGDLPELQRIILLEGRDESHSTQLTISHQELLESVSKYTDVSEEIGSWTINTHDVCNLQFTSGTTGSPKASMLTHHNIINNAIFVGDRMSLTEKDTLCCPPPLYHCFGLVLGLLASITHGTTIVFPSETFDAVSVVDAVLEERCTALHGVPAMWVAELKLIRPDHDFGHLRTGIAAGSGTPRPLMESLRETLNLKELTNTYGMTETSPASFMTSCHDSLELRLSSVGKIMPHTSAKIIDQDGRIVSLGQKGELCVSGYLLQKGYWNNPHKTQEVMIPDADGVMWMHTGDEASFDAEGYCTITGRIKDMIIRGGENIYPKEIEERLMQHPQIANASVVGIRDEKYGETVAAFLEMAGGKRLDGDEVRRWVQEKLARHKSPQHIFWLGDPDVGNEYPLTGSGKVKKHVLRELGAQLIRTRHYS